jgi:hypothetical protein
MLDFVRRRKLTRIAVFRPDHFLPKDVYAKCDFCDSNVVNMFMVRVTSYFITYESLVLSDQLPDS